MIVVRGAKSAIAQHLWWMVSEEWVAVRRDQALPLAADRYLFCQGVIRPKSIRDQTDAEIAETFIVNCARVIQDCDRIFAVNDRARICLIGSESGISGSFDLSYASAKAGLHFYAETKRLRTPEQQLVCLAPTIIRDAGMTLARHDLEAVDRRGAEHPKGRWLTAIEVARVVFFCLYEATPYLTNCVVRLNGGQHTV